MKQRSLLLGAAGLFAAAGLLSSARPVHAPSSQDPLTEVPLGQEHDETVLAQHMHLIEEAVRGLRRSLRKAEDNPRSLELLATLQTAALACKGEAPAMAASLPEAERDAFVQAYRVEMISMLEASLATERAVLAGDLDAAKEHFALIRESEDPGHERFTEGG